ncbi:hypothetical protein ACOMHN_061471 [Nucella lapillus]
MNESETKMKRRTCCYDNNFPVSALGSKDVFRDKHAKPSAATGRVEFRSRQGLFYCSFLVSSAHGELVACPAEIDCPPLIRITSPAKLDELCRYSAYRKCIDEAMNDCCPEACLFEDTFLYYSMKTESPSPDCPWNEVSGTACMCVVADGSEQNPSMITVFGHHSSAIGA